MADIFISYKREDQEEHGRVAPIAEALRAEGYDVFYDVYVPPGSSWEAVLQEKMNLARCVIVLWSHASVTSDWVKEEAEMAKAGGKLIPVFLDTVAPPFGFARIEGANLANWDGDLQHQEWKNLVAAVKARIGQGGGAAAPGVTRVDYTPTKQVEVTKTAPAPGNTGGGGTGKWLGGALAILAIGAAGFFGWQTWQSNEMLRDQAEDAAMDQAMTRSIDERAWRAAIEANTVSAYQRYLDERATGAYRSEAIDRIAALEAEAAAERLTAENAARQVALREDEAWQSARSAGTIEGFEAYLAAYPSGRYADGARRYIRTLQERAEQDATSAFNYDALRARRYTVGPATIGNLRLNPAPPAQMQEGQQLTIEFDYRFAAGQEANIWMRPVIEDVSGQCSYGASGSPALSGSGTAQQSFSLRGGGCSGFTLRQIVMKVGDRSGTVDQTFPVFYAVQ